MDYNSLINLQPVYDIHDCGPRNRFWANGKLVHNCDGINLQNLQRGSRHRLALTAPKNHLVYVADSSNIECLHGDGMVLTDSGLKKLRDVMLTDKLWDGVEWVSHQGVINKGVRNVITYRGITATPDHVVYLTTGEAVQLAEAKARGASLMVGEIGGQAVHWMDSTKQTSATGQKTECLRSLRLRIREIVSSFGFNKRQIEKVQKLREFGLSTHTEKTTPAAAEEVQCDVNASKSGQTIIKNLRENRKPFCLGERLRKLYVEHLSDGRLFGVRARQNRHKRTLRTGQYTFSHTDAERTNEKVQHNGALQWGRNVIATICARLLPTSAPYNGLGLVQGGVVTGTMCAEIKTAAKKTEINEKQQIVGERSTLLGAIVHRLLRAAGKTARGHVVSKKGDEPRTDSEILQCEVWDIVNAGPRHRFVYNGFIVSNCRVNSRFAGQTDLLDGFRHGLDVYSQFASEVVFGYPVDKSMKTERQVGKVCILGLGYGMGWRTFQRTLRSGPMGAPPMECSDEFAQKCVFGYREKYPMIANSWQIASAMIAQMLDLQCDIEWGPLRVLHNCIALPNGLWLSYPGLRQRAEDGPNGPETWFEYWNGKFWKKTYGGLQIENISQCLAGLIIKEQMNKVDRWLQENELGQIVLQVHDEIIVVAKENHPTITPDDIQAKMIEIMSTPPLWFSDIPLNAEGGYAKEYSK